MVQRYIFHSIPNTLHYSSEIHPYVGEFAYICTIVAVAKKLLRNTARKVNRTKN